MAKTQFPFVRMIELSITIPEDMNREIQKTAKREHYSNRSEFIREAIENELERRSKLPKTTAQTK